jgi:Tfp pilus assembly protein PilO
VKQIHPHAGQHRGLPIDAVAIALILAGAAATYYLGIAPTQRAQAQDQADREALIARQSELDTAEEQVADAAASLASLKEQADRTENILRSGSELFTRIQAMTERAQDFSLSIAEISPGALICGKRFNRIPIHLSGSGSYSDFTAFVAALHAMYADLQLVAFKVTGRADDARSQPRFEADLNWYTALEPAKVPSAAQGAKGSGGAASAGNAGGGDRAGLSEPAAPAATPPR